ncbi:MAG TPA: aromatic amino acid ammonia-lyase [Cytophagales bacterium]|nr:aromatic amino acid ammonia-lyase [Cytophagales bacterium]
MILIGGKLLTLSDFNKVLFGNQKIKVDDSALERIRENYLFLKTFSKKKVIYGINTGFGPMAPYRINDEDQVQLQYNLIRSHCSGSGKKIEDIYARALMICRLNSLLRGFSGIDEEIINLLVKLINEDITPVIYEHGSVGASGDLVQLAHLALILIGEGEVSYKGEVRPTAEVYAENGITPISIHSREGLAIMNGTAAMCGIGVVNIIKAQKLLSWSILASSIINEIVESYDDHFSEELNQVKLHVGQNHIAKQMRSILSSSNLIRRREEHLYDRHFNEDVLQDKVQEYYSLRCVPQILGPVYDTIAFAERVVIEEINSVNDNPIIDAKNNNVYHGGNFHGDYVSLEMDKVKITITKLSMLAERQLNFLLNDKLNKKLPPFVNLGKLGLNFGMQGVQFTATSTVAENQTLSFPMYVHSIPNNNDNQDIVSMGFNSAMLAKKVIDNSFEVLSIELITAIQAIDYLKFEERLSDTSRSVYKKLRQIVPMFEKDTIKYKDTKNITDYILENSPEN